jgi:hypothetical protein
VNPAGRCYKCGAKVRKGSSHTWSSIEAHECGRLAAQDASGKKVKTNETPRRQGKAGVQALS